MNQSKIGWAVIGLIAAGCQSPSAEPVPPPAPRAVTPAPTPATQAAIDPRVAAVMRQAQQHMAAVSEATFETPAGAKSAGEKPADVELPPPPEKSPPAAAPSPPPTNPPPGAGLKPVQSIEQLIASGVRFEPPGATAAAAAATAVPAEVAPAAEEVVAAPQVVAPPPAAVVSPPVAAAPAVPPADLPRKLDGKAKAAPRDFVAQLDSQVARVLGEQPPAPEDLFALEPEDRDVVLGLVDGLSNFRTLARRDPNALPTKKIRPLLDMADRLRAKADLAIVNPSLVTRARGYGNFDPILPLRLPAGIAHKPAIYYEIENFSSRIDDKGLYRTNLRQDVVIYDVNGAAVWQWPNEPVIDLCRRQRHDLYFAKVVRTPINLVAGSYIIKITLTDAQRMAEASLPLVITPPPGLAVPAAPAGPAGPVVPRGPGGVR